MRKLPLSIFLHDTYTDPLGSYRDRVLLPILIAGTLLLFPFAINSLLHGRLAAGITTSILAVCYAADSWAIRRGTKLPVPYPMLMLPTGVATAIAVAQAGGLGALWAYPAVLACYFILRWRTANYVAAMIVGGATAMLLMVESTGFIIRYVATLLLSIGIMNVILHVINELQTELLRQTTVDPLTGSYNRRHMQSCLATIAAQSKRSSHPASVLILDIDHFKQINDRFGHPAGDAVLVKIVEVIKNRIRRNDYLFRIGGEEFLVLLPETTTEDALKVAEDLRQAVETSKLIEAECVTISLGVCGYEYAEPVDIWIANADAALYQAKKEGRNKVVRFSQATPVVRRAAEVAESEFV